MSLQNLKFVALPVPEIIAIGVLSKVANLQSREGAKTIHLLLVKHGETLGIEVGWGKVACWSTKRQYL